MPLIARQTDAAPAAPPTAGERPSRDEVTRWLRVLVGDEGCVELRALGVSRKGQSGGHAEIKHFAPDELAEMARAALALSGRSDGVYWTLNPVHAGLYLAPNQPAARDADILARRWLLVDCDPVKSDPEASATDAEKDAAAAKAREVRDFLASEGWPAPILADSGNGFHLLYRVDLPNDDDARNLVRGCLAALAGRFSDAAVTIDTSVCNAGRICKLYGTLARKGAASEARPHRYSRVLDVPAPLQVAGREWLAALAAGPAAGAGAEAPATPRAGLVAKARPGGDPVRRYALAALADEVAKVAGAAPGGRNDTLNESAFKIGRFVGAGAITEGDAIAALATAGLMAGPNEAKIRDTVLRGLAAGKQQPRDLSEVGRAANGNGHGNGNGNVAAVAAAAGAGNGGGPMVADDDPHRLARAFLAAEHAHADGPTLRFWMERWHRWDGGAWRVVADAEVAAELTRAIKREFDRIAIERGMKVQAVGTKVQGNALLALRSEALLSSRECPRQPAWIGGDGPNPLECLSARNGIVHLPSLIAGSPGPIPATPRYFTPSALDFDFDPDAPRPGRWLAFLASLWDDDPESIDCLQEWFGYLITPDTRQQKLLLVIGPRRSGKGTILRVLRALVGPANVAAPTLSSLATNFGIAPLIGKTLAIVPDARLSARADAQVIIERLLSITGEDPQTIDRKHRDDWTGDLMTRFAIASNELPRMGDASGALPGRVILLRLTRTFYGREDTDLFEGLVSELPAICLWAIAGWARLKQRREFLQPASGQELLDDLTDLSSPISSFLAEWCETGSEMKAPRKDLYDGWVSWCKDNGRDHPGDQASFGRQLRAALPRLGTYQSHEGSARIRYHVGVRFKTGFPPPKPAF